MLNRLTNTTNFTVATLLLLLFWVHAVNAQQPTQTNTAQVASSDKTEVTAINKHASAKPAPLYTDFMGAELGMTAAEVRGKLGKSKDQGKQQDFFVISNTNTAQVFYDESGKVIAISVDYVGKDSKPPLAEEVIGHPVQARPDGSLHELKRYPEAGYWIAYNRTAGPEPITTITLQKMSN